MLTRHRHAHARIWLAFGALLPALLLLAAALYPLAIEKSPQKLEAANAKPSPAATHEGASK